MRQLLLIIALCFSIVGYSKEDSEKVAVKVRSITEMIDTLRRVEAGQIVSHDLKRIYETVALDYVASEFIGEISLICEEDISVVSRVSVSINGRVYYPYREDMKERAKYWIPLTRYTPEDADEVVCRANYPRTFKILLPDHPRKKGDKYVYNIEYVTSTLNGATLNWKFLERVTLNDMLEAL